MKKILLLLCSLFVAIGTWAEGPAVDGKTFTMQCKRGYVYYNGSRLAGTSTAADASQFAFVTYEENTYLYDATKKAFVCHTTAEKAGETGNASLESSSDFSKAVKGLKWGTTGIDAYPYYLEDSYENWLNMDGPDESISKPPYVYFNTWKDFEKGDGGNTYKVEAVADFDATEAVAMLAEYFHPSATVTYVISDANGVVFTSDAIPATVGATIDALPAELQRAYCSYDVEPVTIVSGENTANVTVSYSLPFTLSASFDDATWYFATIRGTKYVRADESAKDGSGRYQTSNTNGGGNEFKWAFAGNPYTGFTIMNRGIGAEKVLYLGSQPEFQPLNPEDNKCFWAVSANGDGFALRNMSGATMYINDNAGAGNLGTWNSSAGANDAGGRWTVTAVPTFEVIIVTGIENGTVAVGKSTVHEGDVIKPVITPAEGYMLKSLTVKAGEDDVTLNYDNSFTMPAANVTISAEFQDKVYIETDLTSQFPVDWQGWTNATGFVGWAAPKVTTNDGRETAACERFDGSNATTDKVFYRTLTGLANGTYRIELFGAAASTKGRDTGINSDMTSENEGDETAVYLYATTASGTVKQYIPVHWATDFNGSGIATAVLDGVEVTDGTIEIGMFSEKKFTNWHVVQIKGVTAKVDAGSLLAVSVAAAAAVDPTTIPAKLAADIATAVKENNKAYTTATEYEAAIANIDAEVAKAAPYAPLTAALAKGEEYKARVAAGNEAITTYDNAIAEVKAAYDAVTVSDFDAAIATVNAALPALEKAQTADGTDLTIFLEGLAWTCDQGNGPNSYKTATETYLEGNAGYNPGKVMYQRVTGLAPGIYTVKFYATANHAREGSAFGNDIAQLFANDVTEDIEVIDQAACTPTDYERTLTASVVEDGVLEYGLQNIAQGGQWYVAQAISLTLDHAYNETELAYVAAQKVIVDGDFYNVTTTVNEVTYYLTTGGTLTADASEAGEFQFKAVNVAGKAYPTGWNLGCKFTNPTLTNGSTGDIVHTNKKINTGGQDRDDWERQVFFLKDGKYAVRSTNATGTNWGANTYWDVVEGALPNADYSLDIQYKWNLVDISTEMPRKNLLAEIEKANAAAATAGTALFQIPAAAAETLLSAVATAQGVYDNGEATAQELNDATAALQAAEVTFANTERNLPVAGKKYAFQLKDGGMYMTLNGGTKLAETPTPFTFVEVAGGYALTDGNEYVACTGTGSNNWTMGVTTDSYAWQFTALADGYYTIAKATKATELIGVDNSGAGSACYANKGAGDKASWNIIELAEADFTISDALYATFIAPFDVAIPAGVTAYTVDAVGANDVLTLTPVDVTIPANTPVLVQNEEAISQTFYGKAVAADDLTEGLLTGTYEDITAEAGKYVLQNQEGKGVAFYLVDAVKPAVKANHAYLTAPSAGVKAFYLGEVATAIEKVMAGAAAGEIYDLAGRKVSRMVKGNAYIVGGRKVVIK